MFWANFLHIYQPFDQMPDILDQVVNQSYRPIFDGIKKNPKAKLTLNINGSLTELLVKYKYNDLLNDLKYLGASGQIEFTSSAKYHAFLPFLSEEEIIRQIKINDETNRHYLGEAYKPKGFFPPEMAYTERLAKIICSMGFEWIILDEIAFNGRTEAVDFHQIYKIKGTELRVYFRERRISNMIMGAVVRSDQSLIEAMKGDIKDDRYLITGMDGETFGHHRHGLDKLLLAIYSSDKYKLIKISEINNYFKKLVEISPIESTWASSENDIVSKTQLLSWQDPSNKIHKWQKEFVNWVLPRVRSIGIKNPHYNELMNKMDIALGSDHFWWASAKPWWSLEMIELGAYRLLDIVNDLPDVTENEKHRANDLYQKIISTAFEWQRSGKIREMAQEQSKYLRIPLKDILSKGDTEKLIFLMSNEMEKAISRKEYEKAILWRDAISKIEEKKDIYDTIHVIDLLRPDLTPGGELEGLFNKYKEEYHRIRSGQPEQRGA